VIRHRDLVEIVGEPMQPLAELLAAHRLPVSGHGQFGLQGRETEDGAASQSIVKYMGGPCSSGLCAATV
jgi:hypothetical protein